jgi:hypothetical protein
VVPVREPIESDRRNLGQAALTAPICVHRKNLHVPKNLALEYDASSVW